MRGDGHRVLARVRDCRGGRALGGSPAAATARQSCAGGLGPSQALTLVHFSVETVMAGNHTC